MSIADEAARRAAPLLRVRLPLLVLAAGLLVLAAGLPAVASASSGEPVISMVTPAEGPTEGATRLREATVLKPSAKVSIKGENLEAATEVAFGAEAKEGRCVEEEGTSNAGASPPVAQAASFVIDGGIVEAEPPAHEPGTVSVCVATPSGVTAAKHSYTYGPTVTKVSAADEGAVAGGGTVTIEGKGLEHPTEVVFIGTCANTAHQWQAIVAATASNLQEPSPGKLTVTAPPQPEEQFEETCRPVEAKPTVVDVVVKAPNGWSARTAADRYYYGPSVESVTRDEGPVAGGETVTVKGHGFKPECANDEVRFKVGGEMLPATCVSVTSAQELKAVVPAAPGATPALADVQVTTGEVEEEKKVWSPPTPSDRYYYGPNVTGLQVHAGPAAGGNTIAIAGHGFTAGSTVSFGGTPASGVEFVSAEEIKARAPEHATGAVHITVTTPQGTSAQEEASLYAFGLPFVESVTPGEGSSEGGSPITIRGQNLEGVSTVRFSVTGEEYAASHIEVKSPSEIVATSPTFKTSKAVWQVVAEGAAGASPPWRAARFATTEPPVVEALQPEKGPNGAKVRIVGTDLAGIRSVSFGGTPASFTLTTPFERAIPQAEEKFGREIIATAPRHALGEVHVKVTGLRGTSAASPGNRFTYLGFGIESLEASACLSPLCSYLDPATDFFTQAAGYAEHLLIGFTMNSSEPLGGTPGTKEPVGILKSARFDLPPGMVLDPQAVPQCATLSLAEQGKCPGSLVGSILLSGQHANEPWTAGPDLNPTVPPEAVFNIKPPQGAPAMLGFVNPISTAHHGHETSLEVFVEGHVSWHREPLAEKGWSAAERLSTGDYHAYSTVVNDEGKEEAPDLYTPLVGQKLEFEENANAREHGFITMPSACSSSLTYHLTAESYGHKELGEGNEEMVPVGQESETARRATTTSAGPETVGVTGCNKPPFQPEIKVTPETAEPDHSDGVTVEVKVPQGLRPIDSADPRQISITLPEGMTVNPSSANGLEACSEEQFGIVEEGGRAVTKEGGVETVEGHEQESAPQRVECPTPSKIGTFEVESPDLPEALRGDVYIGQPRPGATPESGEEYRIFLHAEAPKYGVDVRLVGHVSANSITGRLTTTVENPQLPFSRAVTRLNGPRITIANPIACEAGAKTESVFQPYGGPEGPAAASPLSEFALTGGCPFRPGFSLSQAASLATTQGGANTTFTLEWNRGAGQQYLTGTRTTLPAGLTGSIKSVPVLCGEEDANRGTCPAESQIGRVLTASGSGMPGEPGNLLTLGGQVYLTGPYAGAPYGLAIVVPAEHVGPYNYGKIVTRAKIEINPETTQVTTTSSVPTIVGGAPVRLRRVQIQLNRPGFMYNATHCSTGAIESTLSGAASLPASSPTATQQLNTPYAATGCTALPFRPDFTASTQAKTSRTNGASLTVRYTQRPGEAHIQAVDTQLPKVLPSRLATLQKACTEAQFARNPAGCPAAASVGTVIAKTPLLSAPLTGNAVLVSHGGSAFPDLDFLLEGGGVKARVVGHTDIKNGITYSKFETVPDTPVESFELTLPEGPQSLLAANASFCSRTVTTKKRVPLRRHGHVVRRHGHVVYKTKKVRHQVPVSLIMPTTLIGQNGAKMTQNTKIEVSGCPARASRTVASHAKLRAHPKVRSRARGSATGIRAVASSARGALTVLARRVESVRAMLAAGTHRVEVALSEARRTLEIRRGGLRS